MSEQEQLAQARQLITDKQFEEAKTILRQLPDNDTAQQWLARLESMSSPDETTAALQQAQALIQNKQYADARAILSEIADHPTAQKWLAQIEQADPASHAARTFPAAEVPVREKPAGAAYTPPTAQRAAAGDSDDTSLDQVIGQASEMLVQSGINLAVGQRALIIAVVTGLVAALLDKILGMPGALIFTFGGFVALLNGPVYAWLASSAGSAPKLDRAAWIVGAVSGLVSLLVWYLVLVVILGTPDYRTDDPSSHNLFRSWFDEYTNLLKVIVTGPVMGLIGLGWLWLVPRLPHDLASLQAMIPGRDR